MYYKKEYEILCEYNVNIEICIVEWIFSLFSSIIPLEIQMEFYLEFFSEGWIYFYKMCISAILHLNMKTKNYIDPEDIYIALKMGKDCEGHQKQLKKWSSIIKKASEINLQ